MRQADPTPASAGAPGVWLRLALTPARGLLALEGLLGRVLTLPIWLYQRLVSPVLPPACRYHPSCSQYARESLEAHGALAGLALGAWRLLRCHPWARGGPDPVPSAAWRGALTGRFAGPRSSPTGEVPGPADLAKAVPAFGPAAAPRPASLSSSPSPTAAVVLDPALPLAPHAGCGHTDHR
ncbi:MAG: membrane protein insertion efficiency factor YidD [Deltaproteobacteria bacterium]|nr:membrane protein insertion efficiency factor YidD [Deltaproteobacteria bacterium]